MMCEDHLVGDLLLVMLYKVHVSLNICVKHPPLLHHHHTRRHGRQEHQHHPQRLRCDSSLPARAHLVRSVVCGAHQQ